MAPTPGILLVTQAAMSKFLVFVIGISWLGAPAWAVRCGEVLPVPWPWEALTSESDQKRVYINWVHDLTDLAQQKINLKFAQRRIQKQTEGFLSKVSKVETFNDSASIAIEKADLEYLLHHPKRVLRAADPDRIHVDVKRQFFRMIDSQSIEEARAMELAETKRIVPSPVSRSYRHGADMIDGRGIHYSLKQVASHFNDQKDRTKQSFERALETLEHLGQQKHHSISETIHLALDMRHLENDFLAQDVQAYMTRRQTQINITRSILKLPPLHLVFIY